MTDSATETNGLPTFAATVEGITDTAPYFRLDFGATHTLVWDINCNTTGMGTYPPSSCSSYPVLAEDAFDGEPLGTKTGSF